MIRLSRIKDNDMDQLIRAELYKIDQQRQALTRLIIDRNRNEYAWLRPTLNDLKKLLILDRRNNPQAINISQRSLADLQRQLTLDQARTAENRPTELQDRIICHLETMQCSITLILNLAQTTAYPHEDQEEHLQRISGNAGEPDPGSFRMLVTDRSPKAQFKHLREFMLEMRQNPTLRDMTLAEIYAIDEDSEIIQRDAREKYCAVRDLNHYIFIGVFPPYEDIPDWIKESTPWAMRPVKLPSNAERELTMNEKLENLETFLKELQKTPKVREMSIDEIYRTDPRPRRTGEETLIQKKRREMMVLMDMNQIPKLDELIPKVRRTRIEDIQF